MNSNTTASGSGASGLRKASQTVAAEPVMTIGALAALLNAGLFVLFSFVPKVSDEQQAAVLALATAAVPIIGAVFCRGRVSPVSGTEATQVSAPQTGTAPATAG